MNENFGTVLNGGVAWICDPNTGQLLRSLGSCGAVAVTHNSSTVVVAYANGNISLYTPTGDYMRSFIAPGVTSISMTGDNILISTRENKSYIVGLYGNLIRSF